MIFVQMYLAPQGAKANQAGHQFTLVYLCNCRNCICIIIKIVFYDYHKFICIIIKIIFICLSQWNLYDYQKSICIIIAIVFEAITMSIQVQIAWLLSCHQMSPWMKVLWQTFSICMSVTIVFVHLSHSYL